MIERLQAFYRRSSEGMASTMSPIWVGMMQTFWTHAENIMAKGSTEEVRNLLDNFQTIQKGAYGIEHHEVFPWTSQPALELLTKLARHIGVMPYDNPENPEHVIAGPRDWQSLKKLVEEEMGFELALPDHLGLKCKDGLPSRFFHYCAAAWSIRKLLGSVQHMLEIGPGFGNLGVILHRWKSQSYSVVDLPLPGVLCAYALSKTCGEENIWLWGEPENQHIFARVYPSTHCENVDDKFYDAFNSDSFPEIGGNLQQKYLDLIADRGHWFFSVNHESDAADQISVRLAVKRNGKFKLLSRHPFPIRQGYVEEVYTLL